MGTRKSLADMKRQRNMRTIASRVNRLVVSVRHRDGWCATRRKHTRYSDCVPTLCGYNVALPWGIERRKPDCPVCLRLMTDNKEVTGK